MMHEQGMQGPEAMFLMKIWEDLTEEQKTALIGRMIDAKIQMKENMIKHLKFKIDTFKMVKEYICECK